MSVDYLTKNNFKEEVMNSDLPVLIDFFATWCGPCHMVSPIIEEISNEHSEYKICKVDVDQDPELAQQFRVSSIPTLVLIKNGKVVNTSVGALPKEKILEFLKS